MKSELKQTIKNIAETMNNKNIKKFDISISLFVEQEQEDIEQHDQFSFKGKDDPVKFYKSLIQLLIKQGGKHLKLD